MRILALVTDAYGGHGGIAKFNRDLLDSLQVHPSVREVVVLPRLVRFPDEVGGLQPTLLLNGLGGKLPYARAVGQLIVQDSSFDIIVCGHVNLLPFARLLKWRTGAPLVLVVHGVEVWEPTPSRLANASIAGVDAYFTVSEVTGRRFRKWAPLGDALEFVLPNSVQLDHFGPGPKPKYLLDRYSLHGRTVIMTLGRMDAAERAKGFDQIIEVLPRLLRRIPDLTYLAVGDGNDRERLVAKAQHLGVSDRVVFTGYIDEEEKADHYLLADAYVMPSCYEGFGIVYLEAMACGIPVVGSRIDGSCAAIRDERYGLLVDPADPAELEDVIIAALARPHAVPEGLDFFSFDSFKARVHEYLHALVSMNSGQAVMGVSRQEMSRIVEKPGGVSDL